MHKQGMFCKVCDEITTHSFNQKGNVWLCDNKHKDDGVCCHQCGNKLDKGIVKIMKALGASHMVCGKCRKAGEIKDISKTLPLVKDISKTLPLIIVPNRKRRKS